MYTELFLLQKKNKQGLIYILEKASNITSDWESNGNYISANDLIHLSKNLDSPNTSIITLPSDDELLRISSNDSILITAGTKTVIEKVLNKHKLQLIEVTEAINANGEITSPLTEPNINKVLRKVFQRKSETALMLLSNSIRRPLHQSTLKNVLHTARVKTIIPKL